MLGIGPLHNFKSTGFEAVRRKIQTSLNTFTKIDVMVDTIIFKCRGDKLKMCHQDISSRFLCYLLRIKGIRGKKRLSERKRSMPSNKTGLEIT